MVVETSRREERRMTRDLCQPEPTSANSWTNSLTEYCVNFVSSCCDIVFVFLKGRNKIIALCSFPFGSARMRTAKKKTRDVEVLLSNAIDGEREWKRARAREKKKRKWETNTERHSWEYIYTYWRNDEAFSFFLSFSPFLRSLMKQNSDIYCFAFLENRHSWVIRSWRQDATLQWTPTQSIHVVPNLPNVKKLLLLVRITWLPVDLLSNDLFTR